MYRALYRKWRPQTFADVVGQEAITAALSNQITSDKIGHAYLFTGTRGTGKTSCAKIFAKAVNCEDRHGAEPCGQCPMCLGLENGSILDVMEIDAASNNGVDDVRDLREETAYRPSRGRYRVYIIDEVHMLTTAAFNALLKTLEEPPDHVIFILATTEIHKVPATILSRCQRFDFGRIPAEKIADMLKRIAAQEDIGLDEDAADLLARLGDGSARDATSILETCAGLGEHIDVALVRRVAGVADKDYLFAMAEALRKGDSKALLETVASLRGQSMDMRRLCEELVLHYRSLLLAKAAPDGSLLESVPLQNRQQYLDEAARMNESDAINAIRRFATAMDHMGRSPDPRIDLELALFDLSEKMGGAPHGHVAPAAQPAVPVVPVSQPVAQTPAPSAPLAAAPAPQPVPPPKAETTPPAPQAEAEAAPEPASESELTPPTEGVPSAAEAPPVEEAPPVAEAPAEPETDPAAHAAPPPPAPAPAAPEATAAPGEPVPFEAWPQVLEQMGNTDRMLYSFMKDSTAYTDGMRVLIDGGELFLTFMRTNDDAKERIKTAIAGVTGKRYGLGPYEAREKKQHKATAQDTLDQWEAMGVDIQYE